MIKLELFVQIMSVLEIVVINLLLFSINITRKYSWKITFISLVLSTLIIVPLGILFVKSLGIFGNGNALFTLFGFFYLLPFFYLFEGTMKNHFYILCFCWVYTLLVFVVSVHFGYVLHYFNRFNVTLIVETILFICSYGYVELFIKEVYTPLLECQYKNVSSYLNKTGFVWFVTILILNLQFVFYKISILKIIVLFILGFNILQHFRLIYEVLNQSTKIGSLKDQVTKDTLTQIGNRKAFIDKFNQKIKTGITFVIVYCDLDDFKTINDSYGHLNGDKYLKEFASHLIRIVGAHNAFRISGDEFAMYISSRKINSILNELNSIVFQSELSFLGASYGCASYPRDGQNLRA